jgi:hypothetical protein
MYERIVTCKINQHPYIAMSERIVTCKTNRHPYITLNISILDTAIHSSTGTDIEIYIVALVLTLRS